MYNKLKKISNLTDEINFMWYKVKDFYYNLKWFFKNLWNFRKIMWEFRSWDHIYCINLYAEGLKQLKRCLEHGNEERYSANKKIVKIQELIDLLQQYDTYYDELDEEYFSNKESTVFKCDENGDFYLEDRSQDDGVKEKMEEYGKKRKQLTFEYRERIKRILFGQSERETIRLSRDLRKQIKDGSIKLDGPSNDDSYNLYVRVFDGSGCWNWWD